ncbi:MAG: ABC transporter ATP-binding protein [Firmicutes bacterium]|nr:ABC transporter ATP-binding protein [Bacillota bacterium]
MADASVAKPMSSAVGAESIVQIKDLHVGFKVFGGLLKVLNGVNMVVGRGEKIGIVGETGCGKTTTVKSILRILPGEARIFHGEVLFQDKNVYKMHPHELQKLRGQGASMIFQDPTAALNPVFTLGEQISEIISHSGTQPEGKKEAIKILAVKAFREATLPDAERMMETYPFQLSGGMRQRACIAMALATPRDLMIADEPTTNLDVTIQDQVLRLLKNLVDQRGMSLILITHSLGVARETTDRIYIMYAGNMVEVARTAEIFERPLHPYTTGLLSCIPKLTGGGVAEGIPGRIPDYMNPPAGCRFEPRCPKAMERCKKEKPEFVEVGKDHQVACFLYYQVPQNGVQHHG